ncbi:uncharacterized protein LOC125959266 [Anopheles darlingi]|uniref:uncharacterized protein LOC125959266 n=1 Tax=Anopheles darlingi TaxID=43151 RepID=UPI0020FFFDB3|nr:uncharacterized protein LOC125959266 [Anopheles darlingi]
MPITNSPAGDQKSGGEKVPRAADVPRGNTDGGRQGTSQELGRPSAANEGARQLAALEEAMRAVTIEAKAGHLDDELVPIKADMLEGMYREGCAVLSRLEAKTGAPQRRGQFCDAYAAARVALGRLRKAETASSSVLDATTASPAPRPEHLPRIDLPKFGGDPSDWPSFASRFERRLSGWQEDATRYAYLQQCFAGYLPALQSAESFEKAGMPFEEAWLRLQERFYKKRVAFLGHFRTILEAPRLSSASSNGLMRLIDVVETAITSARQVAGKPEEAPSTMEDGFLVSIVLSKLDDDSLARVTRKADQQLIPTWKELRDELDSMANRLYYEPKRQKDPASRGPPASKVQASAIAPRKAAYVATTAPAAAQSKPKSCIARDPAGVKDGPASSASAKPKTADDRRLCYACDKMGHKGNLCPEMRVRSAMERVNLIMERGNPRKSSRGTPSCVSRDDDTTTTSIATLLATVIARVLGADGQWHQVRCIMDSGSQIDAITIAAATRLPMPLRPSRLQLDGVSGPLAVTRECETMVANCDGTRSFPVKFYVIPELPNLPYRSLKGSNAGMPTDLDLADKSYYVSGPVDVILGAGVYFASLLPGMGRTERGLTIQNSVFGWLVGGLLRQDAAQKVRSYPCGVATVEDDLRKCIERFWEVEDASLPWNPGTPSATAPELEAFFRDTTSLAPDGRYVVKIPLRGELSELGDSYQHGVRRLLALERKLERHSSTYDDYRAFMREYIELGHMTLVAPEDAKRVRYVIPHSCVVKPESSTTKLRVVFDASAKSITGVSLNDLQTIGPVLQPDLLRIWLDFRLHTVVATADIAKMYRQVWVSDEDTWMQCILWRDHRTQPMQTYRLRTVTYGEAASSYLACRALQEAGEEVRASSPAVADAIRHGFYVDNLSLGAATSEELRVLCSGVEQTLLRRGMPLRKWASNMDDVLYHVPPEHREAPVKIGDRDAVRMLGLSWCPTEDTFQLVIGDEILQLAENLTKRGLVARISKLYDPVGILQPVIITAKMIMQDLWREDLAWDDCVSPASVHQWNEFTTQLPLLRKLHIPRMAAPSAPTTIRIDGFCDASLKAYGCVFYVTFTDNQGNQTTRLLCSKARVAPLKTTTLPRLELQAALLLSELYVRIRDAFDSRVKETYWWSDSQVALSWIRSDNTRWDVYVKHRVAKIQVVTATADWRYVPTKLNPADIISRGISARKLIRPEVMAFWLNGPTFLNSGCDAFPEPTTPDEAVAAELGAVHSQASVYVATVGPECDDLISQYRHHCSFSKTRRHFAWLGRAVNNFKAGMASQRAMNPGLVPTYGPLTHADLEDGLVRILRRMQATAHPNEVNEMLTKGCITPTKRMQHLNPVCVNGLIYVQGRLQNAELADGARLPILVPKSHPFSRVMIRDIHERIFHAGVSLVIAEFRTRYWMRDLRRTVLGVLARCVPCAKARPRPFAQQMGPLPEPRVNASPPFTHTGVDLCGPFVVLPGLKGHRSIDVYVCIFVCFATKAVHLEVVEDQSTQAFISALMRFVSLRGKPSVIHCDNGRNFIGAARELQRIRDAFTNAEFQHSIIEKVAEEGMRFAFIPPRSPNFGGLWEANIKVAKRLLKAAAHGAQLRMIEMQTLMHQISAILNSRPLTAVRTAPEDVELPCPSILWFLLRAATLTILWFLLRAAILTILRFLLRAAILTNLWFLLRAAILTILWFLLRAVILQILWFLLRAAIVPRRRDIGTTSLQQAFGTDDSVPKGGGWCSTNVYCTNKWAPPQLQL